MQWLAYKRFVSGPRDDISVDSGCGAFLSYCTDGNTRKRHVWDGQMSQIDPHTEKRPAFDNIAHIHDGHEERREFATRYIAAICVIVTVFRHRPSVRLCKESLSFVANRPYFANPVQRTRRGTIDKRTASHARLHSWSVPTDDMARRHV